LNYDIKNKEKEIFMLCAICGQAKTDDELRVFSYGAYTQILSILKMNTGYSENIMASQKDSPVHKIFLGAGVILVEYAANVNNIDVKTKNWNIAVLPLKIRGADGAPARVFLFK